MALHAWEFEEQWTILNAGRTPGLERKSGLFSHVADVRCRCIDRGRKLEPWPRWPPLTRVKEGSGAGLSSYTLAMVDSLLGTPLPAVLAASRPPRLSTYHASARVRAVPPLLLSLNIYGYICLLTAFIRLVAIFTLHFSQCHSSIFVYYSYASFMTWIDCSVKDRRKVGPSHVSTRFLIHTKKVFSQKTWHYDSTKPLDILFARTFLQTIRIFWRSFIVPKKSDLNQSLRVTLCIFRQFLLYITFSLYKISLIDEILFTTYLETWFML